MLEYLLEIRKRLIHSLVVFFLLFLLCFCGADSLYHFLFMPLMNALPHDSSIIATSVTSLVFTPLQLAFHTAFLLSMPLILWHIWRFVAPGLYSHEKKVFRQLVIASLGLFLLGVMFAYAVVLPFMYQFFIAMCPVGVQPMPDIHQTMAFSVKMLLLFGLSFQVPVLCVCLLRIKLLNLAQMRAARPYVIIAAFIVGMLLTPPDVLSQCILAIPICLLYELGLFWGRLYRPSESASTEGTVH